MKELIEFCKDNKLEFHMFIADDCIAFKFYSIGSTNTFVHRIGWNYYNGDTISKLLIDLAKRFYKIED